jgi:dipeptidyl aminopeptidase/acylaminoacyl peptidase
MTDNPTWTKTWSGSDNTHRVWASRLHTRLTHLLLDNQTPILIVHGAEDFDNVPVESARTLVSALTDAGQDSFTHWEVPGMKHGPASLPADRIQPLFDAMRDWLLTGDSVTMP